MSAEKLRELKTLASVCPELNMANYTEDDVRHLNDWAIEISLLVEQYALSQQPATGEPGAWNSIQIASWIGSKLMHEPSMFERATVCKFVRSLGRHPTLIKHSPKTHPAPSVPADVVRVPLQVLKDASEALGNFVSDHGWGDADMQAMDNLDAYIARHEANRAAMLAAK